MSAVLHIFVRILESMFFVGMAGSVIVIILSFVDDLKEVSGE
jgi:hypothetical protein